MPNQEYIKYKPLFDTINSILTIGGGLVGGGAGSIAPGAGNLAGALGGAALGSAGGKSIENLFLQQLGEKPNSTNLIGAAINGAEQEAAGRILGLAINNIINGLKTSVNKKDLVNLPEIQPERVEYHGGPSLVEEPNIYFSKKSSHGPVFHTTPQKEIAEDIAAGKVLKRIKQGLEPYEPTVSSFYVKANTPPGSEYVIKNIDDVLSLGKEVGLGENALNKITHVYKHALERNLTNQQALDRAYTNLTKQGYLAKTNLPRVGLDNIDDFSNTWGQILKDKDIRRLVKPLTGMGKDYAQETINFNPEQDLIFKPGYDIQQELNKNIYNKIKFNDNIDNTKDLSNLMIKLLGSNVKKED